MNRLLLWITLAVLAGCSTTPRVETRYQNVLIAPDDNLLQDCQPAMPPDVEAYVLADWATKEKMLFEVLQISTENIILCNVRQQGLRDWKKKQVQIFSAEASASSPK